MRTFNHLKNKIGINMNVMASHSVTTTRYFNWYLTVCFNSNERKRGGIWSLRRKVANGDLSGWCDAFAPKKAVADSPYETQERLQHVWFVRMFGC